MASQFLSALQYEDLEGTSPDIQEVGGEDNASSLEENTGFYTFFIPEETDADQLKLWTALLDAAWAVREPFAGIQEKGMYTVLRSMMAHSYFDMPAAAVIYHCQILCMKLGIRCDPNHFCAHYQHNAGAEQARNSGQPIKQRFKRPKEPLCKLSIEQDPLIN